MTEPQANPASLKEAWRGKPLRYKLATVRMWQQHGQAYAEMFRGGLTTGGIVGAVAHYVGITSRPLVIAIGFATVIVFQVIGTVCGYWAWRTKVIEHTFGEDWKNDPWKKEVLTTLRFLALKHQPRGKHQSGAIL